MCPPSCRVILKRPSTSGPAPIPIIGIETLSTLFAVFGTLKYNTKQPVLS